MKKTITTLLIIFVFFATSCNQTRNQAQMIIKNEINRQEIVAIEFDHVGFFRHGLAAVRIDGKYGFIDRDSNIVIPPQFAFVFGFHHRDFSRVRLTNRGEEFLIDRTGRIICRDSVALAHRKEAWARFEAYPLISSEQVARIAPVIAKCIVLKKLYIFTI